MPEVTPILDKLAGATGVVFDVRGYPTDAGVKSFRTCSGRLRPTAGCT